jgi:hypothetical protein
MTPKEKATELINIFFLPLEESLNANVNTKRKEIAKKHALISVNELLFTLNETSEEDNSTYAYHTSVFYNEVKTELKKL